LKIRFTPKVAYRMIDRARRTFCKYPHSTVPQNWKDAARQLQVFIIINPKLQTTAGTACFVKVRDARTLFQIPDSYPPVRIDGVDGYLIIEINPKQVILDPVSEVYDTVSHEFAHCLDYFLRGWYGRTDSSFHDEYWSFLHKRMGGNGIPTMLTTKTKTQLHYAKKKADKITLSFDPLDNPIKPNTIKA
jgi:hypothetical protein